MSNLLIEQLQNADLIKGSKVNIQKIDKISVKRLLELSTETSELTTAAKLEPEKSPFTHSATLSLGGGKEPCCVLACRLKHAKQLAQFAAFYSDRVYIYNFLADYAVHAEKHGLPNKDEFKKDFAEDLTVFVELLPLIKTGKIVPITPPKHVCPRCFSDIALGQDTDKRFIRAQNRLARECEQQLEVTFTNLGDYHSFGATGPETILEHGSYNVGSWVTPEMTELLPRILKKQPLGKKIPVSRRLSRLLGFHDRLAHEIFRNVRFELVSSRCLNTKFLTDREVHVKILRELSQDEEQCRRDELIKKHLTCFVPFIDAVNPSELILLRDREEESFVLFRTALVKAMDQYHGCGKQFSKRDAEQIYADIIAPELARLDLKVRKAHGKLKSSFLTKSLAWIGTISLGIYTGIVPEELKAAATAIGLAKPFADLLEATMNNSDVESPVRSEEMYFLWKVREMSRGFPAK